MAKAPVTGVDLKSIRSLLTAAERKVFDSSIGKEIARAGREQLQAAVGQARTLRDKWRDLYARQTRSTKRKAEARPAANDRSRDKADLFAGAVERLEKRLVEVGTAAGKTAGKTRKKATKKAARSPSKKARTAGHRATRAGVKSELKQAVAAVGGRNRKAVR